MVCRSPIPRGRAPKAKKLLKLLAIKVERRQMLLAQAVAYALEEVAHV